MDILTRRDFMLPQLAASLLVKVALDRNSNRGVLVMPLVAEYLSANLSPEDLKTIRDPIALSYALIALSNGGVPRKARYLVKRPLDEPRVHSWQQIGKSSLHQLREVSKLFRVSLDDLAAAAIYWAAGIPDDQLPIADSKGHNLVAPPIPAPTIPEPVKPDNVSQGQWDYEQAIKKILAG